MCPTQDQTARLSTWDNEDARLLWQATARADALMRDLARGRPTAADLEALLGYLREVVLARVSDEDRHALPALRQAPGPHPELDQLDQQHLELRSDVEDLAAAAQGHSGREQQAAIIRRLVNHLETHLAAEARLLHGGRHAVSGDPPWLDASHWFPLIGGPVIELDELRDEQVEGAVLNRLTRLRADEQIQLHGHRDPHPIWLRLQQRDPGGYSWEATQDAGARWSVAVCRRGSA